MATKSAKRNTASRLKENDFTAQKNKGPASCRRTLIREKSEFKGL
jgi:hypothetical protein